MTPGSQNWATITVGANWRAGGPFLATLSLIERMTVSKRKIRRDLGRHKAEALAGRTDVVPTRLLWSLPGLLANLISDRAARHHFLYQARLTDGRSPAKAISDGDDFEVLRHLRAIAAGNHP
jgi:hypothetical protein